MNYSPLKGLTSVFDYTITNDIQDGLVEYFDWGLLQIGNYFNVTKGEVAPNGSDYSRLRLSLNGNYETGQVWEGFRSNWVWQSGISYSSPPIVGTDNTHPGISGVYVNDVFYPITTTGNYAHHVDYFNGRVIFENPIPTGSKVQAEYSYKWINVTYAHRLPWLTEAQSKTSQPNGGFLQPDQGPWVLPPESRLQLPAIAIETVSTKKFKGYQLGGGQWVYIDVIFHCIAEDDATRNKLVDIILLQNNKTIALFDSNKIYQSGAFPIDYRGVPVSGALRYPDIVSSYFGGNVRLTESSMQQMIKFDTDGLFGGIVRVTTEGIKTNI
jgi:hypothetical protein